MVSIGVGITKAGYVNEQQQKWLSKLNMTFFTPCLLFTNIASVISIEKLLAFWPIPVFHVLFLFLSWAVSLVTSPLFGVQGVYRRFVTVCTMFCNTNSLPIAIISSLAFSEAGRLLFWHADDTQQTVAARGLAYTLFYAMFCNITRWSYGYHLLQPPRDDNDSVITPPLTPQPDDHPSYASTDATVHGSSDNPGHPVAQPKKAADRLSRTGPTSPSTVLSSFPNYPNESSPLLPTSIGPVSPSSSLSTRVDWKSHRPFGTHARLLHVLRTLQGFMSPPLYAALLALAVGLSPLKPVLFDPHSFVYASVTKALESCGKMSVPLILICLGSELTLIGQRDQPWVALLSSSSTDSNQSCMPPMQRAILTAVVTRMLIMPVVVFGLVIACLYFLPTISLLQDPMFVVSIIVVGTTPTAITLSQLCANTGMFQEEMIQVLFWSYGLVCVPAMATFILFALYLVQHWI
ncbi:auxin efflux carrier [Hesseltinella vesiculosa]|uniref:Auxin efflux carrier n=1 Tax=Hesseltinella vesiculosa TaxID=101127 RepID=A0A1X2GNV1_9FUNG|nr:auxin efflux carrier [Hesseltinella vesiculosa]